MISAMSNALPEFDRPPVDEMVMGFQLDPLPGLRVAHLGLYWSRIRAEYPHTEDQPPLPSAVESEEIKPSEGVTTFAVSLSQLPRCWFVSGDKTQLIQVQRDRFWRNWRKVE